MELDDNAAAADAASVSGTLDCIVRRVSNVAGKMHPVVRLTVLGAAGEALSTDDTDVGAVDDGDAVWEIPKRSNCRCVLPAVLVLARISSLRLGSFTVGVTVCTCETISSFAQSCEEMGGGVNRALQAGFHGTTTLRHSGPR